MKTAIFFAHSLADLPALAADILATVGAARRKFILAGEMGAGKTTLTAALCRLLGVVDTPASPTYALVHSYARNTGEAIHHIDLYRVTQLDEALYADLEAYIFDENYCFIEWADILLNFLPADRVEILLSLQADETRRIEVRY